jgi:hypothetical protein
MTPPWSRPLDRVRAELAAVRPGAPREGRESCPPCAAATFGLPGYSPGRPRKVNERGLLKVDGSEPAGRR